MTYRLKRGGKWMTEFDYSGKDSNEPMTFGSFHEIRERFPYARIGLFDLYESRDGIEYSPSDGYKTMKLEMIMQS